MFVWKEKWSAKSNCDKSKVKINHVSDTWTKTFYVLKLLLWWCCIFKKYIDIINFFITPSPDQHAIRWILSKIYLRFQVKWKELYIWVIDGEVKYLNKIGQYSTIVLLSQQNLQKNTFYCRFFIKLIQTNAIKSFLGELIIKHFILYVLYLKVYTLMLS